MYTVYVNDGDTGGGPFSSSSLNGGAGYQFNVLNDAINFCVRITAHKTIETISGTLQLKYIASLVTPTGISYYYNSSVV